jgi:hypothetical protein
VSENGNASANISVTRIVILSLLLAGWCGGVTVDGTHYDVSCGCGGVKIETSR